MTLSRYEKYETSYKAYYYAHREEILKYNREWRQKHPNIWRRYRQRWLAKNPDYYRNFRKKHPKLCRENVNKWKKNNPEKVRVGRLITHNPKKYPLDKKCAFCNRTEKLEHGHLDYEDKGYNYVTVCHQCNLWMANKQK